MAWSSNKARESSARERLVGVVEHISSRFKRPSSCLCYHQGGWDRQTAMDQGQGLRTCSTSPYHLAQLSSPVIWSKHSFLTLLHTHQGRLAQ